jgi:hypothetical protein
VTLKGNSPMRMFAVSESKGWVELRGGKSPPRRVVTRSSKVVERAIPGRAIYVGLLNGGPRFEVSPTKFVKEKRTIVHTAWVGGRVLGVLPARKFATLFNVGVKRGGCVELLPAQIAEIRPLLAKTKEKNGRTQKAETAVRAVDGGTDAA